MGGPLGKVGWKIISLAFTVPAGKAARRAMNTTWKSLRGTDPPTNPAGPHTTWTEALLWSAVSGVAFGVARMIAARGAAATWRSLTGSLPPAPKSTT